MLKTPQSDSEIVIIKRLIGIVFTLWILLYQWGALAAGPVVQFERLLVDGLKERPSIYHILQDHQGFLWFATQDGLYRYDGCEFKAFRHQQSQPDSIASNDINSLFEDSDGTLWIGSQNGISRFNRQTQRFEHFSHQAEVADSLSNNSVMVIFQDSDDQLWFGTQHGLNRFNPRSSSFEHFFHDPSIPASLSHNDVRAIA